MFQIENNQYTSLTHINPMSVNEYDQLELCCWNLLEPNIIYQ